MNDKEEFVEEELTEEELLELSNAVQQAPNDLKIELDYLKRIDRTELDELYYGTLQAAYTMWSESRNLYYEAMRTRNCNYDSLIPSNKNNLLKVNEDAEWNIRRAFNKVETFMVENPKRTKEELQKYLAETISMKIISKNPDEIIITMPMALKRLSPRVLYKGKQNFTTDSTLNYKMELEYLLGTDEEIPSILSTWKKKTIQFFYVYGKEEKNIIDTDGHDTKSIIDAVAQFIPTGDAGVSTRIIQETRKSNELPTQTVIVLSKDFMVKEWEAIEKIVRDRE